MKKDMVDELYQKLKGTPAEDGSLKAFKSFVAKEKLRVFNKERLSEENIVKELIRREVSEYESQPAQILRVDGIAKTALVQLASVYW